jgi:hypothetical protein
MTTEEKLAQARIAIGRMMDQGDDPHFHDDECPADRSGDTEDCQCPTRTLIDQINAAFRDD